VSVERRLQSELDRVARDPQLTDIVAVVERPTVGLRWHGHTGDLDPKSPFFVASTTKLHTTAILLRLIERGVLRFGDRLLDVVDDDAVRGVHVRRGVDRTGAVTIEHLMSQTSGIADYFQGRLPGGRSLETALLSGSDRSWSTVEALDMARSIGAAFTPGARRRALYSDTNYQLLGMVIEHVTGETYADALRREITEPLHLGATRLYTDPTDCAPHPLRHGDHRLDIPLAMASFGPDGGIVSTADDLMRFVRAFFEGELFDASTIGRLQRYRRIFFPLQYGVGIARFSMPRVLAPFGTVELIGHSGLSGAFAFLAPTSNVYVAGTVNNIATPRRSFELMLRLVRRAGEH
jgi:CubicO group peptidase (beta-lactamase class C family)